MVQRVHPEDRADVQSVIERASGGASDFEHAYRLLMPDGRAKYVHALAHTTQDASGNREFVGAVTDITDQKRAEEELRASEQKYRHLVDTTPAFFHTALPNGNLDFINRGWLEYLGLSITDLVGWRWTSVIHPEDVEEVVSKRRATLESGQAFVAEARIRRADGKYRCFLHRSQPRRNEAGEIVKWYSASIEIEERKIAEEAIRRGEAILAEAQRLSQTGSCAWNVITGEQTWSEENYRILGYDTSIKPTLELIRDRVHPDDLQVWQQTIARSVEEGKIDFEHRLLMPDGSVKHLHVVADGIQKDGKLVELIGAAMDVTERKRAEQIIRRSEAYLAEAQRLSQTGSWAWNPATGDIRYWSEECYRVLGFDPAGPLPHFEEFFNRIHPDDQAATRERFEKAIRDKEDFELDYRIIHPDKGVRDIHAVGQSVHDRARELVEFVGTVIDVTERKRAEALLMAETRLHEMIATGVPLKDILNALCLIIEEQRSGTLASVLLLGPDGVHLESLAGPGLPEGWTRQIASLPIGPCAGSCGTAAYRGSPVIVSDIVTDPLWEVADHRASALSYGLRASWSYPILFFRREGIGNLLPILS